VSKNLMVDFKINLCALDGKPLKERSGLDSVRVALMDAGVSAMLLDSAVAALRPFWGSGEEPKEVLLTAQSVAMMALQVPDQAMTGADRVDRMRLAIRLLQPGPIEITERERETIMKAIEKAYASPVVYFRIDEVFGAAAVERDRLPAVAA